MTVLSQVTLAELLVPVARAVKLIDDETYTTLGVKWYAKGLFAKEPLQGNEIKATRLFRVEKGDFIYNRLFAWKGSFALVGPEYHGCFVSGEFPTFRIETHKLHPSYLFRYVSSEAFWEMVAGKSLGVSQTSRRRFYERDLLALRIPLPPIQEQRRIVGMLNDVDELRQLRAQADERVNDLLPAIFQKMFGDAISNSRGWSETSVRNLCNLVRGSSPRPRSDPRYYGGQIPRLMIEDITRDGWLVTPRVDTLTEAGAKLSRSVPAGTIVMAVSGNVGLMAQLAVDACIHDGFVAFKDLRTETVNEIYFMFCMTYLRKSNERLKAGAIFQNLTTDQVKGMLLPIPPLPLQLDFAARVAEVRALQSQQARSCQRLDDLFQSLLHRAFRGEL